MPLKLGLNALAFLALVAAVVVAPFLVSDFHASDLALVGAFFIALVGLDLLTGYSGQISLGHGAFMAIGGYTSAILIADHGWRDVWTIPVAGLVAGAAGALVGIPALRLSGLYLALVTFGIAVSFPQLLKQYDGFTGGTTGKFLTLPQAEFGLKLSPNHWLYALSWTIALVLLAAAWALLSGRTGRALRAIRDSEVAAISSGVGLARYKILAFAVSAFYAGVGGALYAIASSFVNPGTFPITLSIFLVVGLVVGGLGTLSGLVLGAAFIYYVPRYASSIFHFVERVLGFDANEQAPGVPSLVLGIALILVLLILPTGAGGLLRRLVQPLTTRLYSRS
jgi:branched-chain amino acid transport system permease protein